MRTNTQGSSPGFVVDYNGAARNNGRQIDWTKLDDSYRQGKQIVKANGAAAAGATSITVDALPVDVPLGTILNFGTFAPVTVTTSAAAAEGATSVSVSALSGPLPAGTILDFGTWAAVTVTINDADVNAGETAITVLALSGPLPAGAVLDFGASIVKLSAAAAAGATSITVEAVEADIADSLTATFPAQGKYAELTAAAAAAATSLTVAALPAPINSGATATFQGGTSQARLTAAAAKGGTTLTVDELQFIVANDAEATLGGTGSKVVKAGTIMAELSTGKVIPRKAVTGAETASMIIVSTVEENAKQDAATGYGMFVGGAFYEDLLPDRDESGFATWIGEIRTNGGWVRLEKYSDSRAA